MHVIVIGAGLLGVSTAYFLKRNGADVTVLESEDAPALGASYGNGGYSQASVADPWNAPGVFGIFAKAWLAGLGGSGEHSAFVARTRALPGLVDWGLKFLKYATSEIYLKHATENSRLARYTLEVLEEIDDMERLSYSKSDAGGLVIFRDKQSLGAYVELTETVCADEIPFEILDRGSLVKKDPSLSGIENDLVGAVHFPADCSANSRIFCEQLAAVAADRGVEFVFRKVVEKIEKSANGVRVMTRRGDYQTDAVVVAAGTASKQLVRPLGIRLPIAPAKGYSISVPMKEWANRPRHVIIDMGVHAGINPMGDVLRVAGTAEFAGMRPGISEERVDYLVHLTEQVFPEFASTIDRREIDPWAGFRPLSADGIPMLGPTSIKNVHLNTGHGGLGWTQAAGSGKAVADHILGVKPAFDIGGFSIGRFQ
jgi:D-amino-acid dehydrogenase